MNGTITSRVVCQCCGEDIVEGDMSERPGYCTACERDIKVNSRPDRIERAIIEFSNEIFKIIPAEEIRDAHVEMISHAVNTHLASTRAPLCNDEQRYLHEVIQGILEGITRS